MLSFGLGLVVRFYDLLDAPLDFHPTRQLHSAVIARGIYYKTLDEAPAWQTEMAQVQRNAEGLIEPQLMENLAALSYKILGRESLWVPRVWSILFWMTGGIFLLIIMRQLSSLKAAAGALSIYLLWPYTSIASRAFQPEPLMTMAILAGLWASLIWMRKKTWLWAVLAGLFCGLAIYIKSVAVFFLAPPLTVLVLTNTEWKDMLKSRQLWVIALLAVLPFLLFTLNGIYGNGLLAGQFSLRFFPQRWIDPVFYLQWLSELNKIYTLTFLLLCILGILLFSKKRFRGFLLGIVAGYVLYGFVFSYHITTHDYYHIPLIIPVSIGFGLLMQGLLAKTVLPKRTAKTILALMLFFLICWHAWQVRSELKKVNYQAEVSFWEAKGEQLGHDKKVIGLLSDYGYPLSYWGWMNVTAWPSSADLALRALAGNVIDETLNIEKDLSGQDYFVVTEMEEVKLHPELFTYLSGHFLKIEASQKAIIYDLNQELDSSAK